MRKMLRNKVPYLFALLVGFFCVTQAATTHAQAFYQASLHFKLSTVPNGLAGTYSATVPGTFVSTSGSGFASIDAASSVADNTLQFVEDSYKTSGGAGPGSGSATSSAFSVNPTTQVVFTNSDSIDHDVALTFEYELEVSLLSASTMCNVEAFSSLNVRVENGLQQIVILNDFVFASITGAGLEHELSSPAPINFMLTIPANSSRTVAVSSQVFGFAACQGVAVVPEPGTVACFVGIGTVGSAFLWRRRKFFGKSNG